MAFDGFFGHLLFWPDCFGLALVYCIRPAVLLVSCRDAVFRDSLLVVVVFLSRRSHHYHQQHQQNNKKK